MLCYILYDISYNITSKESPHRKSWAGDFLGVPSGSSSVGGGGGRWRKGGKPPPQVEYMYIYTYTQWDETRPQSCLIAFLGHRFHSLFMALIVSWRKGGKPPPLAGYGPSTLRLRNKTLT